MSLQLVDLVAIVGLLTLFAGFLRWVMATEMKAVHQRFENVDRRLDKQDEDMDRRFGDVDRRFDKQDEDMDRRFGDVDRRFDKQDGRFDQQDKDMNRRFDRQDGDMAELRSDVGELRSDVGELQTDMAVVKNDLSHVKNGLGHLRSRWDRMDTNIVQIMRDLGRLEGEQRSSSPKEKIGAGGQ